MGCCQSNAAHDESRVDSNGHPADNASQGHNAAPASAPVPGHRPRPAGAIRPNQPLRAPSPLARSPKNVTNKPPPWTRSHLEAEREAFFFTRVTGREEVWGALRQVSEQLRIGELNEAQAILDAANVTCPSGKFSKPRGRDRNRGGVYDEFGELYDIPDWVVTDPLDIVEDKEDKGALDGADDTDDDQVLSQALAKRKEGKGKEREVDVGEQMRVKLRMSDGTPDLEVLLGSKQNAGVLSRKIEELKSIKVTLLHLGKKIDEKQTLEAQGWRTGNVLNCFIHREEATS